MRGRTRNFSVSDERAALRAAKHAILDADLTDPNDLIWEGELLASATLEDLMGILGWDRTGDEYDLVSEDDEDFRYIFEVLFPYVEPGATVEFQTEDDTYYRFVYSNSFKRQPGRISYKEG